MLTTLAMMVMPVLVLLLAAVLNVSHIVHSKILLQNAADRAAYAGAAKQAYLMNEMGKKNNQIHGIFEKLRMDIVPNSSNGEGDVAQKVRGATNQIAAAYDAMEDMNASAFGMALKISKSVAAINYGAATLTPFTPDKPMLTLQAEAEAGQRQRLRSDYNTMVGGQIWEPASHGQTDRVVQSYYVKDPARDVRWQVALTAPMPRGLMSGLFRSPVLRAVAAANPHGASIRECAFDATCPQYQVGFVTFQDDVGGEP